MIPTLWGYALEMEAHTGLEVVTYKVASKIAPNGTTGFTFGLIQPGNYEISCFKDGKTFGKSSIGIGEVVIDNPDGDYDHFLDCGFDGRPAVLRRIDASLIETAVYPDDWTTVYTGTLSSAAVSYKGYNQSTIAIPWRDRTIELQVPLPLDVFKGDNVLPDGLEGTAEDLKNKIKPLVLGQVFEVSPVCVNTFALVYAVSPPTMSGDDLVTDWDAIANFDAVTDFFGIAMSTVVGLDLYTDFDAISDFDGVLDFFGAIRSGISNVSVYDSGIEFIQEAEYVDITDMMANAPTPGKCRILPRYGYIRFGSLPVGQVTVSCMDGSGAANRAGSIMTSVLRDYMKWPLSRINLSDLAAIDQSCSIPIGTYISSGENVSAAFDYLCQAAGICYYFDALGIFRAFQIQDPYDKVADFTLNNLQISNLSRTNNEGIPAKGVTLRQQKCWTVQTVGIEAAVTAERRAWIANEWRENKATSVSTAVKHLLSTIWEFDTSFAADAQSECDRRLGLYSQKRDFLECTLIPSQFNFTDLRLGMIGELQLGGRLGITNKKMILLGITADMANEKTILSLWG